MVSTDSDSKLCFVIAPIGAVNSGVRTRTEGLLDNVVRPVLRECGYQVEIAHEVSTPGSITHQVIQRLLEAELVVADLTGLNANVMYELAVRHAQGGPLIPMAERDTDLPFDIMTERTLFYDDSLHGAVHVRPKLRAAVKAAEQEEKPNNPVYRAKQSFRLRDPDAPDDVTTYIMARLSELEQAIRTYMDRPRRDTQVNEPRAARSVRAVGATPSYAHTVVDGYWCFELNGSPEEVYDAMEGLGLSSNEAGVLDVTVTPASRDGWSVVGFKPSAETSVTTLTELAQAIEDWCE